MIANKRAILAELGGESPHHRTVEIDALVDSGPTSIGAICGSLDPTRGTAIITEGLINYFDLDNVLGMWRRFAAALKPFRIRPTTIRDANTTPKGYERRAFNDAWSRYLPDTRACHQLAGFGRRAPPA